MDLAQAIAWWGLIAIACSAVAGLLAARKNRDVSVWMAWCFVLPPLLLILLAMSRRTGPPPRPPRVNEHD